ncbi:MAG: Fe-S cluster assembly protein SufB, partial [Nitrososphaerales archaeon]
MTTQEVTRDYSRYGFSDSIEAYVYLSKKGLSRETIENISDLKKEPEWMREFRLKAYDEFLRQKMPNWGGDLSNIDFDNVFYYAKASDKNSKSWEEVPEKIRNTFEKLGIPEAERNKLLAGVGAQYDSETVYHSLREDLQKQGVIFCDTDTALREHEDILKKHFAKVIPPNDNKFAALNSAVWSGGSFVYVPEGATVDLPLQAYFRINAENVGQFERTLIIAEPNSKMHYIEGCTAPVYSTESLHCAVVEVIAKKGSQVRYTTLQN